LQLIVVQAKLAAVDSRYVDWLEWTQNNGVIKAVPNRVLSMQAKTRISKVFKELGGGFVRRNGTNYYELVTRKRVESNSRIAEAYRELTKRGLFEEA